MAKTERFGRTDFRPVAKATAKLLSRSSTRKKRIKAPGRLPTKKTKAPAVPARAGLATVETARQNDAITQESRKLEKSGRKIAYSNSFVMTETERHKLSPRKAKLSARSMATARKWATI